MAVEVDGDQVLVRVADGGPGIPDDVAERLFKDRVAVGRGLGLGLFLTDAMMAAQGGSVQLEQRRPRAIFVLRWSSAGSHRSIKGRQPKDQTGGEAAPEVAAAEENGAGMVAAPRP